MANATFFSPDGGITKYPLEDTEGRTTYEEEIHGINLLDINLADLKSINTSGAWNGNAYTINGITFTLQNNNTITGNGTASADTNFDLFVGEKAWDYVVKGTPTDGSSSTYYLTCNVTNPIDGSRWPKDTGNGVRLYSNNPCKRIRLSVLSGVTISNAVFMPMIVEPEYAGIPFRPYNQQSIQRQINDITGVTGVRNWLPHTYTGGAIQGVTYNFNSNDELVAQWSSTPTGSAIITYTSEGKIHLIPGKTYKLTGCPSGGEWSTNTRKYRIYLYDATNSIEVAIDTGNGAIFTATNTSYVFFVVIGINAGASGSLTFKPMISLASDPSTEFVPHVMTNRELTEKVTPTYYGSLTPVSDKITAGAMTLIVIGEICILNGWITVSDSLAGNTVLYNLPSEAGVNIENDRRPFVTSVSQTDSTKTFSLKVVQNQIKTDGNYNSAGTYTFNIIFTRT